MKYIPYVFNKADMVEQFDSNKQYENWLAGLLRTKRAIKIRNNLYALVDISGYVFSNKFEITTKITQSAFSAYHSALEYYGLVNQVFNQVIVCSLSRFNNFTFNGVDYICHQVSNNKQVDFIFRQGIRVSSLERTVIDCIDRIDLAGGIEELLNALEQIKVLDEDKLLAMLASYNQVILYQKVGYIFEHYKDSLTLSDNFFAECKRHLTNQVKYFLRDEYKELTYNPEWKLVAPKNLKSRIYGGL